MKESLCRHLGEKNYQHSITSIDPKRLDKTVKFHMVLILLDTILGIRDDETSKNKRTMSASWILTDSIC